MFGLAFGMLETHSLLSARHNHAPSLAATSLFFALAWTLALENGDAVIPQ